MAIDTDLSDALDQAGISSSEFLVVIQALFDASPSYPNTRLNRRMDGQGSPVANASITRRFDGFVLKAEDRGPTFAVWVIESAYEDRDSKVFFFDEFPRGRLE
jgi:hypothetical protein